jgi:phospholipid/cholesterol/gamma-HCH transport system ATP-binding protein
MKEKIKLSDLHKSFGEKRILRGVDLPVFEGETLCIIGRSGTGKSVLIKHLIGLLDPDEGSIEVDGELFTGASPEKKRDICAKFGVLFQGAALFDSMNVYDNIAFGLRRKGVEETLIAGTVSTMIESLSLQGCEERLPSDLSGGFQKRVALARSLVMKPEIMLYDEPTTGVDPITAASVDAMILSMKKLTGVTSIVITHDMNSAYRIADRVAMLNEGKIIFTGTPADLQNTADPLMRQFLEGRAHGPLKIS